MDEIELDQEIVRHTLYLIICENTIGSIIHSFKIPLGGQFLSMNQVATQIRLLLKTHDTDTILTSSMITSLMKGIAPSGKKLTPMLAILSQGFLLNLPISILGINHFSILVGIILSATWSFVQSSLTYYLFFGNNLISMLRKILNGLEQKMHFSDQFFIWLILGIIVFKIIATIVLTYKITALDAKKLDHFIVKNKYLTKKKTIQLIPFSTLFILTSITLGISIYFSETNLTRAAWAIIRPISLSLFFYYAFKYFPEKWITKFFLRIKMKKASYLFIKIKSTLRE